MIELHVGTFRAERKENGAAEVTAERASEEDVERGEAMKSLYGEVVEVDDGAFPLPLDDANDRADKVLPPSMIERRDSLVRATREGSDGLEDAILAEESLVDADTTLSFDSPWEDHATGEARMSQLEMRDVSVEAFDTLPEGTDLASCVYVEDGWLGNFAYMDKCAREVWGYGHNDDGTLSGGEYRFALVSVTVRNPSDEAVQLWPKLLFELAVRHDDGTYDIAVGGYDLDFTASGDVSSLEGHPQAIVLAPGGERASPFCAQRPRAPWPTRGCASSRAARPTPIRRPSSLRPRNSPQEKAGRGNPASRPAFPRTRRPPDARGGWPDPKRAAPSRSEAPADTSCGRFAWWR